MKRLKRISILLGVLLLSVSLVGCQSNKLDLESSSGRGYQAFEKIVKTHNSKIGYHMEMAHWGLPLAGGDKFEWSKDMSKNMADFAMVMDAKPFIDAGLKLEGIPKEKWIFNPDVPNEKGVLIYPYNVSDKHKFSSGAADAMRVILGVEPSLIKEENDLYILDLADGFEVKWNEKSMVFQINPATLVENGLDVESFVNNSDWTLVEKQGESFLQKEYKLEG